MNDLGAVISSQSMQNLAGQFLGVVNGKTSVRYVKKEIQSSAERVMDEEMLVAVASTNLKLKVVQCLPNILFSGRFVGLSLFG